MTDITTLIGSQTNATLRSLERKDARCLAWGALGQADHLGSISHVLGWRKRPCRPIAGNV